VTLITNLKIYFDAFIAVRSRIPLTEFLEAKYKILMKNAPKGDPPLFLSIQPDGDTVRTELQKEDEQSDELIFRKKHGDIFSDEFQRKALQIQEEISNFEIEAREAIEFLRDVREAKESLIKSSRDMYFLRNEVHRKMWPFFVIATGEIAMLFYLVSDFFGLDPLKIGENALRFPQLVFFSLFVSIGIFLMFVRLGEQVLSSKGFLQGLLIGSLSLLAFGVGILRAQQIAALQMASNNSLVSPLIYSALAFGLSLCAASFKLSCEIPRKKIGEVISCSRRLDDLETLRANIFEKSMKNRARKISELENISNQYSVNYQRSKAEERSFREKWEIKLRGIEAYLAATKIACNFWENWQKRQLRLTKLLKLLSIALPLLALLLFSLFGCRTVEAQTGFNLFIICDRSSSANEFACSKENIQEAVHVWVERADEAGGGIFEVHIIGNSFDSTQLLISESYPNRFPGPVSINKKAWRDAFFQKVSEKTSSLSNNMGSAIVEAIYRCWLRIPDIGKTLLVVASDMREVNESYNFERRVPSPEEFAQWLDSKGITPNFPSSTEMRIFGVHPHTPEGTAVMTPENYGKLIKLWQAISEKWAVKTRISELWDFGDY